MNKTFSVFAVIGLVAMVSGCEVSDDGTAWAQGEPDGYSNAPVPVSYGCVAIDGNGTAYPFAYPNEGESTGFEDGARDFKVDLTRLDGQVTAHVAWRIDASYPYHDDLTDYSYSDLSPIDFDYTDAERATGDGATELNPWQIRCDVEDLLR